MRITLLLLLSACAHLPVRMVCTSYCGMLLEGYNSAMSCDVLDQAEAEVIASLDSTFCASDPKMCSKSICAAALGWQIKVDASEIIYSDYEYEGTIVRIPATGLANCNTKEMWLGNRGYWRTASYPHEMIHVARNCKDVGHERNVGERGTGHSGWDEAGFYKWLEDFRQ